MTVRADDVEPAPIGGLIDRFGTVEGFTELTFGGGSVPEIPAGFFFDDSLPWSGAISLSGFNLENGVIADTRIQRSDVPKDSGNGYPNVSRVSATMTGLSLSSTGSITVEGADGTSQEWLVGVFLSGDGQPGGSLSARFDSPQGGAFSATLEVAASVHFVNLADVVSNSNGELPAELIEVRTLDLSEAGELITLNLTETPFTTVGSDGEFVGFCPGVVPGGEEAVIVSTGEPFVPVRHVFEKPKPVQKHCQYRHQSSTPSKLPKCKPNCPAGRPPMKTNDKCQVVTDCPLFKVGNAKCAAGGSCAEVHVRNACI